MAYLPLIQFSDFKAYVKIGANIKEAELSVHIKDMQELEFNSWADSVFYTDITGLGVSTTRPELRTLLDEYVKPYLVCGAYYKFLLWHGRDITQMGVRVENSESSNDVGDKARAEMMADILRKQNAYLNVLKRKLSDDNYTYDGTVYTFYDEANKKEAKPNIGIKRVGGPKNLYYDKKTCRWL